MQNLGIVGMAGLVAGALLLGMYLNNSKMKLGAKLPLVGGFLA